MTLIIRRPCYATRGQVMRALDVKQNAYNADQVDRNIQSASRSADKLCNRKFFPNDATKYWDWPNYQYAYPWRLWLDANELAANQTENPNMVLMSGTDIIPNSAFFCRSEDYGPPYTRIELDRSQNYSFGNGPTPQRDISLFATFGYNTDTMAAGSLAASVSTAGTTQITVSEGDTPDAGDMILVDSERMIVQDKSPVTTGIDVTALTSSNVSDNLIPVPDVTQFSTYEILLFDSERLLVVDKMGSSLVVKRAWDGTIPTPHTSGTLYAMRQLTVIRGAMGSTATTHNNGVAIERYVAPDLVQEVTLADALVGLTQESSAYTFGLTQTLATGLNVYGTTGHGQVREPAPGLGLSDVRNQCYDAYGRKARSRVI